MAPTPLNGYRYVDVSADTVSAVGFPRLHAPQGVLLHTTDGHDSLSWLQGGSAAAGSPASADYLIDRAGTQFQISPPGRAAYHAGDSEGIVNGYIYRDDELSRVLIGIELEQQLPDWCSYSQHDSLAALLIVLAKWNQWRWPLVILRHGDVALPPGRRLDPQGFQWGTFIGRLYLYAAVAGLPGL